MAAKQKRGEPKSEPPQPQLSGLAAAYARQAAIERAYQEYLALPDADAIARHTSRPNSPREALALMQEAKDEAWRIRVETVRRWEDGVFGVVMAKLQTKAGNVADGARRTHPLLGPLVSVYYDELVPQHQNKTRKQREESESAERLARRKRPKKIRSRASGETVRQSEAAKKTNQTKEHRRMIECVRAFVNWAKARGPITQASVPEFPKPSGMGLKRSHELLGTLFTTLKNPSVSEDPLPIFHANGFQNATREAVTECLAILKNGIG